MAKPTLDDSSAVLAVEGYGDLLFYAEVIEWLKRPPAYIQHFDGKGNLTTKKLTTVALETFLRPDLLAKKTHVAVLADADGDAKATAISLEAALSRITSQAVTNGRWTAGKPRVGLYVVPGAGVSGTIETLVWNAWSNELTNAAVRVCLEGYLECMERQGCVPRNTDKARIGALLSVVFDEDPRLGPGARARKFDFSRPEFAALLDFLRELPT